MEIRQALIGATALVVAAFITATATVYVGQSSDSSETPTGPLGGLVIASPSSGEAVARTVEVVGYANPAPVGRLWLVVYAPLAKQYYVASEAPIEVAVDGSWTQRVSLGEKGAAHRGETFRLMAIATDPAATIRFRDITRDGGTARGIAALPPGAVELQSILLIRR